MSAEDLVVVTDCGDWATEYCWWPDGRYVALASLASLPGESLADVLATACDLVRKLDPAAHLDEVRGVGVGFDDGDVEIVWTAVDG